MNQFPDLERVARQYQPAGAIVPPASFARDGVSLWTLARLIVGTAEPMLPAAEWRSLDALLGRTP